MRLDFRDPDPEVIDISPEGGVVSSLKESKIECLGTDKVRSPRYLCFADSNVFAGCIPILLPAALSRALARIFVIN